MRKPAQPTLEASINAVAPLIPKGRRHRVSGCLNKLLREGAPRKGSPEAHSALLLGAALYRFAAAFQSDLARLSIRPMTPSIPAAGPRRRSDSATLERVRGWDLTWLGLPCGSAAPLPAVRAYLEALPQGFASQLVEWAPPVLQPAGRSGAHLVVANHIPAVLACHCLGDRVVEAYRLAAPPKPAWNLLQACDAAVSVLGPWVGTHRSRIAAAAPNAEIAGLLTDLSRSQYFRIKAEKQ